MPSDTASTSSRLTIPISPTFSTDTTGSAPRSEATTDETPDLGAFTQILWAWNNLQAAPRAPVPQFHPPPSSRSLHTVNDHSSVSSFTHPGLSEASGTESIPPEEPPETVWNQRQLQSYFNLNSITPSTRVHELDENEYDISIVNNYPDQGYEEAEEPPPPSPFSDGPQTVEICEATSDFEIPDSVSLHDATGQSPTRRPMAVPVMGPFPNRRGGSGGVSSGSDVERNVLPTSRPPHFATHSFGRASLPVAPLRERGSPEGIPVHITPRQADFPILDHSSVYSQSTVRTGTTGTRTQKPGWSQTQLNRVPESPQGALVDDTSSLSSYPTQDDSEDAVQSLLDMARVARSVINDNSSTGHSVYTSDDHSAGTRNHSPSASHSTPYYRRELDPAPRATPPRPIQTRTFSPQVEFQSPLPTPEDSEVFVYSPRQRYLKVESVDEDQSRTPTHAPARIHGHILPQQIADSNRYLEQGVSHPYPHPLKGHHGLPVIAVPREQHAHPPRTGSEVEDDGFGEPSGDDLDGDQPSLGLLDEALSFIATERARYEALRASGAHQGDGGPTPPEWQHVVDTSNTKRKRRRKIATTESQDSFPLQVTRTPSVVSNTRPLLLAADPDHAFLESDYDKIEATTTNIFHATNDKRIMILARPKPPVTTSSALEEPLVLTGKKGKRVGRKEREREKAKRDRERAALEAAEPDRSIRGGGGDDWELNGSKDEGDDDVDGEDENGEEGEAEGDAGFSSSGASVSNIHAIRASAGSRAYIHEARPGKGVYKSTPATPRAISPTKTNQVDDDLIRGGDQDADEPLVIIPPVKVGRSRKKSRKRPKALEHAKSFPNLRDDAVLGSEQQAAAIRALPLLDQSKRSRLLDLANRLVAVFPEQNKNLKEVIQRLEGVTRRKVNLTRTSSIGSGKGKSRHSRNGSSEAPVPSQDISAGAQEQDPIELEVVGQNTVDFDASVPLVHVFIDHSNILIGLLNFLKRSPPPKGIVADYLASQHVQTTNSTKSKASSSSPIAIPHSKKRSNGPLVEESPAEGGFEYPIPLPSFATAKAKDASLSKSLPIESALDAHMSKKGNRNRVAHAVISDTSEPDREGEGGNSPGEKKAARFPRHLWHAALVLVLERGRAISRRVVVTSSPLYQPMENIQTLGYEVRVYMRVPNLGDGMDQERKKARYSASRSIYNAKGSPSKKTHMRHVSGSTSADSGSGGLNLQAHNAGVTGPNAATNNATITKIKYREQGVDELLQLKLHQAIADVDVVPPGSTIVLATGDGNVGQFNEDGFLGPVRTALKRGWKVELYAWEDGLSRTWRREFGENSEWGKKGLFRIIPLEQFATSLVEAAGW